jgi:hypothetical protein
MISGYKRKKASPHLGLALTTYTNQAMPSTADPEGLVQLSIERVALTKHSADCLASYKSFMKNSIT